MYYIDFDIPTTSHVCEGEVQERHIVIDLFDVFLYVYRSEHFVNHAVSGQKNKIDTKMVLLKK